MMIRTHLVSGSPAGRWSRSAHRCLIAVAVAVTTTAAGSVPGSTQESVRGVESGKTPDAGEYTLGPEDVVQITVWRNDAMSRLVAVRPDGFISLPLLNDVRAAGLRPMQLREMLIRRLSEYIPSPEVSVIVTEVRSFKVSIIGEVAKPGRYELKSSATALDVLAAAGGFNSFASRSRMVILRPNGAGGKPGDGAAITRIPFDYNKAVSSGGESANVYLQPGDIILVP